ncbi:class I SAM-dependent methyltransferase [Actinopolymorpha alba]|uniref:class I SAM-dependent methyltransferase n=1 Tax=Actinopolymorpha alba TaxID=533267 RepID=UPI00036F2125|nr:class I SAM-dependent methyltransferase [Actinopolymorpha alba]
MRYYYAEHESAYRRIDQEGLTQWNDLFDLDQAPSFEDFPNRSFLERTLADLPLAPWSETEVLEYGCGTGPAACFLAERGFNVDAIDLIPQAIYLARRNARERGVKVHFDVQDMCDVASSRVPKRYDLIVDSYCLQSIVTDDDRARVFAAVRARLESTGYYLISTAMYDPQRIYDRSFRYDESTGICYQALPGGPLSDSAVEFDGEWYVPHRRHLRPAELRHELAASGFRVLSQQGEFGGDLVCALVSPSGV